MAWLWTCKKDHLGSSSSVFSIVPGSSSPGIQTEVFPSPTRKCQGSNLGSSVCREVTVPLSFNQPVRSCMWGTTALQASQNSGSLAFTEGRVRSEVQGVWYSVWQCCCVPSSLYLASPLSLSINTCNLPCWEARTATVNYPCCLTSYY